MKRILFDTNVVLDVLPDRQSHSEASADAWPAVETGRVEGLLSAPAVTTIHYPIKKDIGNVKAKRLVSAIPGVFGVAVVDAAVLQEALQLPISEFRFPGRRDCCRVASGRLRFPCGAGCGRV